MKYDWLCCYGERFDKLFLYKSIDVDKADVTMITPHSWPKYPYRSMIECLGKAEKVLPYEVYQ